MNEQGTQAWRIDRAGDVTSSRVHRLLTRNESAWRRMAEELEKEQAAKEAIESGEDLEFDDLDVVATRWGKEKEPHARELFALIYGPKYGEPELTGYIPHPSIERAGGSPDFLLPKHCSEIKSPYNRKYHRLHLNFGIPPKYQPQLQMNMMCSGKPMGLFISYDPREEPRYQLYVQEVPPDPTLQKQIADTIHDFWEWVAGRYTLPNIYTLDDVPSFF